MAHTDWIAGTSLYMQTNQRNRQLLTSNWITPIVHDCHMWICVVMTYCRHFVRCGQIVSNVNQTLSVGLSNTQIDSIKCVLNQLARIDGDLYEVLLKHCTRLKYLNVAIFTGIIGTGNEWLLRQYPTLEHFHSKTPFFYSGGMTREQLPGSELLTLLEWNPNIRRFSISCLVLLMIGHAMLRSTAINSIV